MDYVWGWYRLDQSLLRHRWLWRTRIWHRSHHGNIQFSSVTQSCPTLCYPMIAAHQASLSLTISWSLPSSYPMNWWCHPTISSSVVPFSSCPQSFPASGSFPMSQLCKSGGQRTGASASALVLPKSIPLRFPLRLTGLISLLSKDRPPNCNSLKSFQIHTPTWCFLGFPVDEYKA